MQERNKLWMNQISSAIWRIWTDKQITIIHAWQDKIIPVRSVIDYAERHKAELHLVNSDHRLSRQIPLLEKLFDEFLGNCKV